MKPLIKMIPFDPMAKVDWSNVFDKLCDIKSNHSDIYTKTSMEMNRTWSRSNKKHGSGKKLSFSSKFVSVLEKSGLKSRSFLEQAKIRSETKGYCVLIGADVNNEGYPCKTLFHIEHFLWNVLCSHISLFLIVIKWNKAYNAFALSDAEAEAYVSQTLFLLKRNDFKIYGLLSNVRRERKKQRKTAFFSIFLY